MTRERDVDGNICHSREGRYDKVNMNCFGVWQLPEVDAYYRGLPDQKLTGFADRTCKQSFFDHMQAIRSSNPLFVGEDEYYKDLQEKVVAAIDWFEKSTPECVS